MLSIEGCCTRLSAERRQEQLTSEQPGHGCQVCASLTGHRHRVQKDGPQGQWEEMLWVTGFISPWTVEVWPINPPRSVRTGYCLMRPCNRPQASVFQLCWAQTALTLIVKHTHTHPSTYHHRSLACVHSRGSLGRGRYSNTHLETRQRLHCTVYAEVNVTLRNMPLKWLDGLKLVLPCLKSKGENVLAVIKSVFGKRNAETCCHTKHTDICSKDLESSLVSPAYFLLKGKRTTEESFEFHVPAEVATHSLTRSLQQL